MAIGGREFSMRELDCDPFPCFRIDLLVGSPNPKSKDEYHIADVLIDTGCDCTILPISLVDSLGLIWAGKFKTMTMADGVSTMEVKIYPAKVKIDGVIEEIIEVGFMDADPLIGMDLINKWHLLLNCPYWTFEIVPGTNYVPPTPPTQAT